MINDGSRAYDHQNDGAAYQLGGCHANLVNQEHNTHAKIVYAGGTLEVLLLLDPAAGWTSCLTVHYVPLPKEGYIGFSAATGSSSAQQDIVGVSTAIIDKVIITDCISKFNFPL